MTVNPTPGYLDEVYPGHTTRAICVCGWISARMPTVKDARTEFEIHYQETHHAAATC